MSHTTICPAAHGSRVFINAMLPMRDGVKLSADIYFPAGEGPFPAVLSRTCHNKAQDSSSYDQYRKEAALFTEAGFCYVVEDVRGRGDSQGEWYPFFNEVNDGFDTVEWIAAQPWCTGMVGIHGTSYAAHTSMMAIKSGAPHLAAAVVAGLPAEWLESGAGSTGGMDTFSLFQWCAMLNGHLTQESPAAYMKGQAQAIDYMSAVRSSPQMQWDEQIGMDIPYWREMVAHAGDRSFWEPLYMKPEDFKASHTAVLHITGWADSSLTGAVSCYAMARSNSAVPDAQYALFGPWDHPKLKCGKGTDVFGRVHSENCEMDLSGERVDFFRYYLRREGDYPTRGRIRVYSTGDDCWHKCMEPAAWYGECQKKTPFFLSGSGTLVPRQEAAGKGEVSFTFDPVRDAFLPVRAETFMQYDPVVGRSDVLRFVSAPMEHDLLYAGIGDLTVHISSDCADTDLLACLCQVNPDGSYEKLTFLDAGRRMRFRDGYDGEKLMEPGTIYTLTLHLPPLCHLFRRGTRLALILNCAHLPLHIPNRNTGHPILSDMDHKTVTNTIHCGNGQASVLTVPLLTAETD